MKTKGLKTIILTGLMGVTIFADFVIAAPYASFNDVPNTHPNFTAIMELKSKGVITGYPDGTFKPDKEINRVETLKIILLGAGINTIGAKSKAMFGDISAKEWYYPYLNTALDKQIINGYPDGTFKPQQTVSLAENLKILINTKGIDISELVVVNNPYADALKDQWYSKYVQYAKNNNWISADSNNSIYPAQGMTRGKLAQLIYNSIHNKPVEEQTQQITQQDTQQSNTNWQNDYVLNVSIESFEFKKNTMTIAQGSKVRWTNKDTFAHSIVADNGSFTSPLLNKGETWTYTFDKKGVFDYHCSFHPQMKGTITVKAPNEVPSI